MSNETKTECQWQNWHDTRHRLIISVTPKVINVWPLDKNSINCAIRCANNCGLEFAACIVQTENGLAFPRIDINNGHSGG